MFMQTSLKQAQEITHVKQRSQVMEPIWSLPGYPQEDINLQGKMLYRYKSMGKTIRTKFNLSLAYQKHNN